MATFRLGDKSHLTVLAAADKFLTEDISDSDTTKHTTPADLSSYLEADYYTETELDGGQLDNRYYTETEVDTISGSLLSEVVEDLAPHLGGDLDCSDYNLDNVGKLCGISTSTKICNNTGSTLTKGTAVTICSLSGETCCVCVSDNREFTKMPVCGVVYADITDGNEGCMITLGRINMDTSGMVGVEKDRLYVQGDGSIDTVIPTSGSVQRVGILVKKAAGSAGRVCICIRGRRSIYASKDEHVVLRMGSDAGHQKIVFKDYSNTEVAQIDSSGNLTLSGTVEANNLSINAIPSSNHSANGPQCDTICAGESITVMQCCYLNTEGEWALTDADATATADGMLVISLETVASGSLMNAALPGTFIRDDTWTWGNVGNAIYLSCTTGAITQTAPSSEDDVIRIVGHATHADRMFFNPEQTVVVHGA